VSSLEQPNLLKTTRQTFDMMTGELMTEMIFASGTGATLTLQVLQFASRSVPSLLCQEILITSSADVDVTFISAIETRSFPDNYLHEPVARKYERQI
jgi:trehalose/maltose hydrolase-like predicted phosphorylase